MNGESFNVPEPRAESPPNTAKMAEQWSGDSVDSRTAASPAKRISPPSLEGLHRTVGVPHRQAAFWRKCLSYGGPALLVSVGYMDPGNWGTDLQGGASYRYGLLWVVAL